MWTLKVLVGGSVCGFYMCQCLCMCVCVCKYWGRAVRDQELAKADYRLSIKTGIQPSLRDRRLGYGTNDNALHHLHPELLAFLWANAQTQTRYNVIAVRFSAKSSNNNNANNDATFIFTAMHIDSYLCRKGTVITHAIRFLLSNTENHGNRIYFSSIKV